VDTTCKFIYLTCFHKLISKYPNYKRWSMFQLFLIDFVFLPKLIHKCIPLQNQNNITLISFIHIYNIVYQAFFKYQKQHIPILKDRNMGKDSWVVVGLRHIVQQMLLCFSLATKLLLDILLWQVWVELRLALFRKV
jgi:hypothetical protein